MKDKLQVAMKRFSGAIIQPAMFLAVTGLILSVGVILNIDSMPGFLRGIGGFLYNLMMDAGINQLSIIFCVGITCAMANRKKVDAAIVSLSMYLFFIYANSAWLSSHHMLAKATDFGLSGTGQAVVLGQQVVDMGVFLGIILGVLTGWIFNKLCDVQFPDMISAYGGTRLVYLVCTFVTIGFAIAMCYIWPGVNTAITACGGFIENSGNIGLFLYGFLNRFLIPTGMHHLIYVPFMLTNLGGTVKVGGQMVSGAYSILMAEFGNIAHVTALDPSVKYTFFGFSKVFGCIGIVMAFIKTAKPERKKQIKGFLLPLLLVAVLPGVTEPLDFMFLFISPLLWFVHSVLEGFFEVVIFALGGRFPFMGGIIDAIPNFIVLPSSLSKWYITFGVGFVSIFVWYAVFVFLIKKFDIKTPGREDDGETNVSETEAASEIKPADNGLKSAALGDVNDIIEGLGGKENIKVVNNCFTRLRVDLKDINLVDEDKINKFANKGIVKKGNNIQIIIGMKVEVVREDVCQVLGME